jgi:hypothetical protein
MRKNSMIEMQTDYQTPGVVEIAFKFGGPLCQSQVGSGNEGFVPDEEKPDIDF